MSDKKQSVFRQAMQEVKPLEQNHAPVVKPKPKAKAVFTRADEENVLLEAIESDIQESEFESGEVLTYARPGVQKRVMRRLRKGEFKVQRVCDLHGETVATAKVILVDFLKCCQRDEIKCVRIIHGKGKRSGNMGPVIKPKVNRWLRLWDNVVAFHSARIEDGGTGAIYVLLK